MPSDPELSTEDLAEVAFGCACASVRRVARALTRAYDEALRPTGLTITQFSLLIGAALADGPSIGRLAEVLGFERTTVTRDLRPLRERGLVEVRAGEDRRSRLVEITPAGRRAVADALPRWREAQARVLADERAQTWPGLAAGLLELERSARAAA
jgi:DNA-binding MarR family transcriptional regulator